MYHKQGTDLVNVDKELVRKQGTRVIQRDFSKIVDGKIRHDSDAISLAIMQIVLSDIRYSLKDKKVMTLALEAVLRKHKKIQNIKELLTLEGQAKVQNMTMQEMYDLAKKEGLNVGDFDEAGISGVGQKFNIVGNGKEKIEIKINGKKIKERNVLSIRSNSGGMHNSSYILIGTDDGKIKVIFGSPEKYEYNPTNTEKAELIFVEQPKSK